MTILNFNFFVHFILAVPERFAVVPRDVWFVPSEPVFACSTPNLFVDQIRSVEYSSFSCAFMLNFIPFEDVAGPTEVLRLSLS